jgi:4a-hydroxytetrahydrobiopterin dehydratase
MSNHLAERHCKPCEGGVAPLDSAQLEALLAALHEDWELSADGLEISRRFEFPAYSRTLGFANAVAWIAISEGHHPDFICAAKVDRLVAQPSAE